MDIDKIILEFRKLYQMDYGIKTEDYTYVVKERGMVDGRLTEIAQSVGDQKVILEFPQKIEEDKGSEFLLSVLTAYFEEMSYDRHFEALIEGTLSKEKASDYLKRIAGKRMDYLTVRSDDLDSVIRIIQATFIGGICVRDVGGLIVFMEDQIERDGIEGLVATIEVELFTTGKWIIGERVDQGYSLVKQRGYLRDASYLIQTYLVEGAVIPLGDLLPYRLIENCSEELRNHLMAQVFNQHNDLLSDEELTATIDMMFEQELNLTDAARALYIHRNTLLYRIEKIHKLTGYDLRKFSDSFIFRLVWMMRNTR